MNWWQRLRNRGRLERELDAELRYHFDREVDDYVRMGMSEADARRRARLDLGGDDQLKESCRDARGTRWVDDIGQDVRFAARLLLKDHRFTLPAVIALALGIGMNGTMFTIVNAMIRGLPIDRPELIMSIHARDGAGRWRGFGRPSRLPGLSGGHQDILRPGSVQPIGDRSRRRRGRHRACVGDLRVGECISIARREAGARPRFRPRRRSAWRPGGGHVGQPRLDSEV